MSKHHKGKPSVSVQYDPGLVKSNASAGGVSAGFTGTKNQELDFTKEGCVFDIDEQDRRQKLAIMLSAIERKSRPWCPICNIRKVARNSKEKDSPLDGMCGLCAAKALDDPKGTRRDLSSWT
jgi:hypothetical protein